MELVSSRMSDRQRQYRITYRQRVARWYNGFLHIAIIYIIGFTALYIYLSNLSHVTPLEWLTVRSLSCSAISSNGGCTATSCIGRPRIRCSGRSTTATP